MKKQKGITLLALIITIIILLLLASVTISTITGGGILKNTENVAEQSEINKYQYKIQEYIVQIEIKNIREISLEEILKKLEEKGLIETFNVETGEVQVKRRIYIWIKL